MFHNESINKEQVPQTSGKVVKGQIDRCRASVRCSKSDRKYYKHCTVKLILLSLQSSSWINIIGTILKFVTSRHFNIQKWVLSLPVDLQELFNITPLKSERRIADRMIFDITHYGLIMLCLGTELYCSLLLKCTKDSLIKVGRIHG